jgi:hypothetical protein
MKRKSFKLPMAAVALALAALSILDGVYAAQKQDTCFAVANFALAGILIVQSLFLAFSKD